MDNTIRGKKNEPVAIETKLGYVISGPLNSIAENEVHASLWISEGNDMEDSLD